MLGVADGVAPLDTDARLPEAHLPASAVAAAAAATAAGTAAAAAALTAAQAQQAADQPDWLAILAARSATSTMQLKKINSTNELEISCLSPTGAHTTFQFYGSTYGDDYRMLANVWTGTSTVIMAQALRKKYADLALTGTYVGGAGAFVYTTDKTTPATWSTTVQIDLDGSDLRFHTYKDNRGGLWQITITGLTSATVNVSTYSAAAGAYDTTGITLLTNLRAGVYTVAGKFLGDDPLNVPSGGAGTARGWLANNGTGTGNPTLLDVFSPFRSISKDTLLKPASNQDFAIQIQPGDGSGSPEFVPYHGVATAVFADQPVFYDGGDVIDLANLVVGQYKALKAFELTQRVYGRNPASGTTNLIEIATSQRIRPNGQLSVAGRVVPLAPVKMGSNYVIMCPAAMAIFDQYVSSFGNKYRNGADLIGTSTPLTSEADRATSGVFLSSTRKDLAVAFRYTNMAETMRRGKDRKPADGSKAFLQHRDASIVKVYNQPYAAGAIVAAGEIQRFSGDYLYLQAPGLFDQLSL